jgi:hypothetical protein
MKLLRIAWLMYVRRRVSWPQPQMNVQVTVPSGP